MAKKKKARPFSGQPDGSFIEFSTDGLKDVVATLKPIMLLRATRKDLRSYRIKVKDGQFVTISASDDRVKIQLRHEPMRITGSGEVLIDNHALQAMLGAYGEPRVRIHLDDAKEAVRFEGLQSKVQLPAYDPADETLKMVPGSTERQGYFFEADDLVDAINLTKGFVDEDTQRYALGGLLFDLPTSEGVCDVVSTDGRRLSRVRLHATPFGDPIRMTRPPVEGRPMMGLPVVPIKAVLALRRLAKRARGRRVGMSVIWGPCLDLGKEEYGPGSVQFVTEEAVLTAECEGGRFPQYTDVLPETGVTCRVTMPSAIPLASVLAVATASTNSESKGVEVTIAGGSMMFEAESNTRGSSRLALTGLEMDGRATFTVDALYFRQFVDCLEGRPIVIDVHGKKDPIMFTSGNTWNGILMPLTRGDEPEDAPPVGTDRSVGDPEDTHDPEGPDDGPKGAGWESVETSVEDEGPSHVPGEEPEDISLEIVQVEATEPAKVETNGHGSPVPPRRLRKRKTK